MKKELFTLASAALIFAGCANEDLLDNTGVNKVPVGEGITFGLVDDTYTRGDFQKDPADGRFKTTWNAEVDEISIAYFGVKKAAAGDLDKWNSATGADAGNGKDKGIGDVLATYKATRTGNTGYFTAKSPADLLTFDGETEANFRVFRSNVAISAAADLTYKTDASGNESMLLKVDAFQEQAQASVKAPFENFVMISPAINELNSKELAVGESLPLSFERPFATMAFNLKGYDLATYGVLKSVEMTTATSEISWSTAGTVDITKKDIDGKWSFAPGTEVKSAKVTLNASSGLDWNDDYYVFMQILPVMRTDAENYDVVFTFETGKITLKASSSKSWEANNTYTVTLDLDNQDYTVLGTTLIVNKQMPVISEGDLPDGTAANTITKFVSNVKLTAEQLAELKSAYTAITDLTLANEGADLGENLENVTSGTSITTLTLTEATKAPVIKSLANMATLSCPKVTTIPADAYQGNIVIRKFIFPSVVTIGDNAFDGATGVTSIGCGNQNLVIGTTEGTTKTSALTTIGAAAFDNLTSMTEIDAPSLTTFGEMPFGMMSQYAWAKILLPNYNWSNAFVNAQFMYSAALTHVDLSGVSAIGGSGVKFVNKTSLEEVILNPNTAVGANAFKKSGAVGFEILNLDKITSVGESAFEDCTNLTAAVKFENKIATISKNAFKNAKITSFDFTNVTTIGESAFEGTKLTAVNLLGVATLEKNVFKNADALAKVELPIVTVIKEGALTSLPNNAVVIINKIAQIDGKAFHTTVGSEVGTSTDPIIVNTNNSLTYDLFVNKGQGTIDGAKLTWADANGKYYQATFKSVMGLF